jgi:hypothetical protein
MGLTLTTLQPSPTQSALFDPNAIPMGIPVFNWQHWFDQIKPAIDNLNTAVTTINGGAFASVRPAAVGDGTTDDLAAFQSSLNALYAVGGGTLLIPAGNYFLSGTWQFSGGIPVTIMGTGRASLLMRGGAIPAGQGWIDLAAGTANVQFQNFMVDGGVTVSTGLLYSAFAGNAISPLLTTNTSFWLHDGTNKVTFSDMVIAHTGGYSILANAVNSDITDLRFVGVRVENCRPHLFGINPGDLNYGSWTGGILFFGNGINTTAMIRRATFMNCQFSRVTGNCVWQGLLGFSSLHEQINIIGCTFTDCGLDGILMGGVAGGVVMGNDMRRIGYVTTGDTGPSVPRWLPNVNATGIDSSGLVKGVIYVCNSLTSVNGGMLDMDGHSDSAMTGNVCRIPLLGEPEYIEDSIAISGAANSGSTSYGINFGNTSQTPWGAQNVAIVGNTFLNLLAGSIRLYTARFCLVSGNIINAPANSVVAPIQFGPVGNGPYQRCYNLRVCHNYGTYAPAAAGTPFVLEDQTYSPMTVGEVNYVYANCPLISNGNAIEFKKAAGSGSTIYAQTVWFP